MRGKNREKNLAFAIAWREPDCNIPSNLCPFSTKLKFLLSQSVPAHSKGSGLPSVPPSLGTNQRVRLLLTQHQVRVTQHQVSTVPPDLISSPSSNLAPIFYPSSITGSLFCHQTPVLFSPVFSGENVPESWSQDKGFPTLAQILVFCFFN